MNPIQSDKRYSIDLEHCGQAGKRYVLRFCGEWVMQSLSLSACIMRAVGDSCARRGCAIVEEVQA